MRQPIQFGQYLLLERLAVGGMAEVFVAKAFGVEGFERLLAIKKILPTMGEDAEFVSMFVDEARIAVQLSHANIVQVLELGKHDERLFIAMEYVSGRDLRQLLDRYRRRGEPLPIPQACAIAARVCEALDYAHRKRDASENPLGIVHRDVSPQNVLVSFDGAVKLIDFGIAKAERRLQETQSGILKGKFSYMSPEQVRGGPVDHRSDVFAAGVLLWELICGRKLFTGDSDLAVLEKVRKGEVPPPAGWGPRPWRSSSPRRSGISLPMATRSSVLPLRPGGPGRAAGRNRCRPPRSRPSRWTPPCSRKRGARRSRPGRCGPAMRRRRS